MSAFYFLNDLARPLLRHLVSSPIEGVPPSRVLRFAQELQGVDADPATVRRLAQDHFGALSTDVDGIARRIIKFTQGLATGMSDAAFLTLDDIIKPGKQGFLIPEIDMVYQKWLSDNADAIRAGTLDGSPRNWVENHMTDASGPRYRVILEALLGPRNIRQAAPPRGPSASSGWRVRPRIDKAVPDDAEAQLIGLIGDGAIPNNATTPPALFAEKVREIYRLRGMTDPPSEDAAVLALWDYVKFFAERTNGPKNAITEQMQREYLTGLVGNEDAIRDRVTALYHARGETSQSVIDAAIADATSQLSTLANNSTQSLDTVSDDLAGLLAMQPHHVGIVQFDAVTAKHITGGRVMHPDDFVHGLLDGYELMEAVSRTRGLENMTDLKFVTDELTDIVRLAFTGKGGTNTHGYVFEVAIVVDRTISETSDAPGLIWKHIQIKIGSAEGPDMVETILVDGRVVARYVQVKSYNDAGRLIGGRSEMLRQTGSDLRRTWGAMDPADKAADGGPLKIFMKHDNAPNSGGQPKVWTDVDDKKVWAVDEDRLVSKYQQPTDADGIAALAAKKTAEKQRITEFATTYNGHINNTNPPTEAEFDAFVSAYDRTLGGTSLRAADKLRELRDTIRQARPEGPDMTMQELAIARLIMDEKNAGAIDMDLFARMTHPDTPKPQFEVQFAAPSIEPHRLANDVRADIADAAE